MERFVRRGFHTLRFNLGIHLGVKPEERVAESAHIPKVLKGARLGLDGNSVTHEFIELLANFAARSPWRSDLGEPILPCRNFHPSLVPLRLNSVTFTHTKSFFVVLHLIYPDKLTVQTRIPKNP